ncbi:MAG: hypothetical protein GX989_03340 [Firmicutes bacterium]|nr:hypothetical protein [Bacillota bacterium]
MSGGGYLDQNEIDSLLKGISSPGPAESKDEKQDSREREPANREENAVADRAASKGPLVERVEFAPLKTPPPSLRAKKPPLEFFQNISLELSGELGATEITVRDFLKLAVGSVIKLDKMAGESAAILLNGQSLGQAEVVVINDRFGLRVTAIGAKEGEADDILPAEKGKEPLADAPHPAPSPAPDAAAKKTAEQAEQAAEQGE